MKSLKAGYPSEAEEQSAVIQYCAYRHIPIFHIPNGGTRNPAEAKHLKQQGVKAGVPDLFVPVPNRYFSGLFIEMKAQQGKVSEYQKNWIQLLNHNGYLAVVCYGFQEAKEVLDRYISQIVKPDRNEFR